MSGKFVYPPPNSEAVTLDFNYRDSVDVTWQTTVDTSAETYLTLWYYLNGKPWVLGYNKSVPASGSTTVELNILDEAYYAQFNLDFGSKTEYLSCFFNVDYKTSQNPVMWGSSSASTSSSSSISSASSTSTSSTSSSSSTTSSSSSSTSSTSSASTTTSTSSSSSSSSTSSSPSTMSVTSTALPITAANLSPDSAGPMSTELSSPSPSTTAIPAPSVSTGAIAGIAIGAVAGVVGLLAMGFFLWRRNAWKRNAQKISESPSSESGGHHPYGQYQQYQQQQQQQQQYINGQSEKVHLVPDSHYPSNSQVAELSTSSLQELQG